MMMKKKKEEERRRSKWQSKHGVKNSFSNRNKQLRRKRKEKIKKAGCKRTKMIEKIEGGVLTFCTICIETNKKVNFEKRNNFD